MITPILFRDLVMLEIAYASSMLGALQEDNLRIHRADGDNWVAVLGSVDTVNKVVSAELTGFSMYGLKAIPSLPPSDGGGGGDTGGGSTGADSWASIQADILQSSCVMCHNNTPSAPMGLSWEADQYEAIVTNGRMSGEIPSMLIVEPATARPATCTGRSAARDPTASRSRACACRQPVFS